MGIILVTHLAHKEGNTNSGHSDQLSLNKIEDCTGTSLAILFSDAGHVDIAAGSWYFQISIEPVSDIIHTTAIKLKRDQS